MQLLADLVQPNVLLQVVKALGIQIVCIHLQMESHLLETASSIN